MRETAKKRLEQFAMLDHVTELDLDPGSTNADLALDHWISAISLVFPGMKATFQCHFSSKTARSLAARILGEEERQTVSMCHSFITEFCNLTGGAMKNAMSDLFERVSSEAAGKKKVSPTKTSGALSIPDRKPSYDETALVSDLDGRQHMWELCWEDSNRVICTSIVEFDLVAIGEIWGIDADRLVELLEESTKEEEHDPFAEFGWG
jgi:hypothetical protein